MKALVILDNLSFGEVNSKYKYKINIDGESIPLALVQLPNNESNTFEDEHVLIRKMGFSLNYRDKGLIQTIWNKMKNNNERSHIY